jgi:putative FmdB family regulatory protein
MPAYHFECPSCSHRRTKLLSVSKSKEAQKCEKCGGEMVRNISPPTSQTLERLDNGFMNRAIERPVDAERLYKERANKDPSKED